MKNFKLSKYVSLNEAIRSQIAERNGIKNWPEDSHLIRMIAVARLCFDPIREFVGGALFVSSFFRNDRVNELAGGSKTSDHRTGRAIDIDADYYQTNGVTNAEIFHFAKDNLDFDQLVWEYGDEDNPAWVHISYRSTEENRREVLIADKEGYRVWEN